MSSQPVAVGLRPQVRTLGHVVVMPGPQVAGRRRWVKYRQPVGVRPDRARHRMARRIEWPDRPTRHWAARFADDRDLAGVKLALVGLLVLIVMVLEVPW